MSDVGGFFVFMAFVAVALVGGAAKGCVNGRDEVRREAVVNGVATYEADENGRPVFKWKKPE